DTDIRMPSRLGSARAAQLLMMLLTQPGFANVILYGEEYGQESDFSLLQDMLVDPRIAQRTPMDWQKAYQQHLDPLSSVTMTRDLVTHKHEAIGEGHYQELALSGFEDKVLGYAVNQGPKQSSIMLHNFTNEVHHIPLPEQNRKGNGTGTIVASTYKDHKSKGPVDLTHVTLRPFESVTLRI
ncbi:MAG: hypothetical protein KGL95_13925, partial [Patescibacteria group bacterium]|nr:hypothetical protein [Patescibacteria group bacterium]